VRASKRKQKSARHQKHSPDCLIGNLGPRATRILYRRSADGGFSTTSIAGILQGVAFYCTRCDSEHAVYMRNARDVTRLRNGAKILLNLADRLDPETPAAPARVERGARRR
jgi:hypothetical protein